MQAALDCFPCLLRQALQAARFAGAGGACQRRIVNLALEQLREAPDDGSPLAVASAIYEMVCRETGQPDPYRKAKEDCTHEALRWLPELRERLETAADPFGMALKAAVAGNVMDYGAFARFDVSKLLERLHEREFTICDRQELEARLGNARSLTYFADNAGEIVFDRLLIESLMEHFTLDHVHLVVRSEPFLNDVCRTEAEESGVTGLPGVEIVELSVPPAHRDPHAWSLAVGSDAVIAKGMANFENYSEHAGFHFLFIAKCDLIARLLGGRTEREVSAGDWILHCAAADRESNRSKSNHPQRSGADFAPFPC